MTPRALFDRFRTDAVDVEEPFFWSDDEVLGYLHDAQQMFVRLTGGLRDASSAVTQIAVTESEEWVDIDESILRIRSATLASNHRPVRILSWEEHEKSPPILIGWPEQWNTEMYLDGPVVAAIIGMEEEKLRLIRIPVEDDTLQLVVERLPVQDLAVAEPRNLPSELEIRAEHHLALLLWMKHLAYNKQDAETFDKVRADNMYLAFNAYCAKALDEKNARNHKPRLISYGGL